MTILNQMKKILFTVAAALTMVSCSQDDLMQGVENRPTGAIGANVFVPTVSRGTALNEEGDLVNAGNGFDLYAFRMDTNGQFMGTDNGDNNVGVSFVGNEIDGAYVWDYEDKSQMRFWSEAEEAKLKFYAVSPKNSLTDGFLKKTVYHDNMTLKYTVPTTCSEQVDLMYAVTEELLSTEGDHIENGINLQFHHALSQIVFKAKTESALISADVAEVKITNVYQKGDFETIYAEPYRVAEDKSSQVFPWSNYTDKTEFTAQLGETLPTNINTTYDEDGNEQETTNLDGNYQDGRLTDSSEALLLIPQNLEENGAMLAITCTVRFNGANGEAVIVDNQTIEVPVTTQWEPGYKYTYTLVFTAEMGNPIKVMSVGVDRWNDAGNTDVIVDGENGEDGGEALPAMELEPTGLWFDGTNIIVEDADDLAAIAKYTGNRTVAGVGGGVYWLGEAQDGKYPMYDLQFEDDDDSDNSIPAPSDWTEDDVINLIYYNVWREASCLQVADINLDGVTYTPIVVGSYDGDDYSVSNLTLTSEYAFVDVYDSKYGCFVYATGEIKDLHIKTLKIGTSTDDFNYAGAFCNADVVSNCSVDENSVIYGGQVAGICCDYGTMMERIENCVNKATIIGGSSGVGICFNSWSVKSCVNYGNVSGREAAGILQSVNLINCEIVNCHNYGNVKSSDLYAGGIAAHGTTCHIQYCHNEGNVEVGDESNYTPGAIVGNFHPVMDSDDEIQLTGCYNVKNNLSLVGGIEYTHTYTDNSGTQLNVSFTSCYNTASANALIGVFKKDENTEYTIVTRPFSLTIKDCYYTNATAAYSLDGVGEGVATIPDINTCIKLDGGEPENSNYSWSGTPMTQMNTNLSEYTYQDNSDSSHPLKLSGEPTE